MPSVVTPNPKLTLENVSVGNTCRFKVFLHDDLNQVGANAADRTQGSFTVIRRSNKSFRYTSKGSGNYYNVADDNATNVTWHFTIYWHLE